MKSVIWDDQAIDDLVSIADYIAQDSPRAANKVATYIRNAAGLLETSPKLGRASADEGVRELILARYPYILVYEVVSENVRILAVMHHAQLRP